MRQHLYFDRLRIDGRFLKWVPGATKTDAIVTTPPVVTHTLVTPASQSDDGQAFIMHMYAGSAPICLATDHNIVLAHDSSRSGLVFIDKSSSIIAQGNIIICNYLLR